jgi:hypothetical protein
LPSVDASFENVINSVVHNHFCHTLIAALHYVVTFRPKGRQRVWRQGKPFIRNAIGKPLMVKAASIDSLLRIHPKVDNVDNGLEHSIDNRPSTRASGNHEEPSVL